ncbi:MAG TPA: methylmalonyl-CoA mutase family protein [Candidatus Binatia bacterium]|jgi:methylmalonyl-CoA mutase N-terminal domain/subunit
MRDSNSARNIDPRQARPRHATISGMELEECYRDGQAAGEVGEPGQYPFTRGVYPTMYRTKAWTMRQFAGFGSAADTNARFKYLLAAGGGGLSTAFDMPTLMGYDADHARAEGEVGREGVAVSTIADMQVLFDGIRLDEVTTSMTVNCSASILLAMYLVVAERQGCSWKKLGGTIQNDMFKEFIAQKEWICPPEPSLRIVTDMIEFCMNEVPRWHPVSISGYHIREAGSTAVQELAFTLADGIGYVQAAVDRGLDPDEFGPRLSFFFNVHNDFLEEIAKIRAARRLWAKIMRERFGAKTDRACLMRTHAQTSGVSLTAQQPLNNVVRVTIQALAATLAGVQSLHTNSLDETLALPSEEAVTVALRTQQILAEESGIVNTVDPFGGSFAIEALTDRMEREAADYIRRIDELGGIVRAIEIGYPQSEIADAAYAFQHATDDSEYVTVGVNGYVMDEGKALEILRIDRALEAGQREKVKAFKAARDAKKVAARIEEVRRAAVEDRNLMPHVVDAVRDGVTVGEISDVYRNVFGIYQDPATI